MRKGTPAAISFLVLAIITLASSIPAAAVEISDFLVVWGPSGNVVGEVELTEAGVIDFGVNAACYGPCGPSEGPNNIYYINDLTLPDPGQYGNATTLCESEGPCSATQGYYSDIFGVFLINGDYFLGFNSDSETLPAAFGNQGAIFLPEWPGEFAATNYLSPSLQAQGYTALFFSQVPEPGTLMLLGAGLLGIVPSIKRKLVN